MNDALPAIMLLAVAPPFFSSIIIVNPYMSGVVSKVL